MRCLSFSFAPEAHRLKRIVFRSRPGVQPGFACRPTRDQTLWQEALRVREGNSDWERLARDAVGVVEALGVALGRLIRVPGWRAMRRALPRRWQFFVVYLTWIPPTFGVWNRGPTQVYTSFWEGRDPLLCEHSQNVRLI